MQRWDDLFDELNEQLDELATGLIATGTNGGIEFNVADKRVGLEIHRRVAVTPATALRLISDHPRPGFVIGDNVHAVAAEYLSRNRWSFWDRRGRLRVWLPDNNFRLDMNGLRSFVKGASSADLTNPVVGSGSIAVAVTLLTALEPDKIGVREIARSSGMNASTISRARSKLVDAALIDRNGRPLPNELFWATSKAWRPEPITVNEAPSGEGWVLGGDSAAALHGAAVFGERTRWYTLDGVALRRWSMRHRSVHGNHEIALAPTPLVMMTAANGIVHPVVAALDLALTARGREILMSWTTPPVGRPVWL